MALILFIYPKRITPMTQTTQAKIKKVSFIFRWLFIAIMIALPIINLILWINAPTPIDISGKFGFLMDIVPKGVKVLHPLSWSTKLYGFLVSLIPILIIEFLLYSLVQLFRHYEKAEIFTLKNVSYIKRIGIALLLNQIVNVICNGALSGILSWNNPHGYRVIVLTLSGINLSLLLMACIIILISWVMSEGYRLKMEQQLTI